jgi:hypothetical protein
MELSSITDRMEVRRAVQAGNMEEAIERVNDINPEVHGHSRACALQHLLLKYAQSTSSISGPLVCYHSTHACTIDVQYACIHTHAHI